MTSFLERELGVGDDLLSSAVARASALARAGERGAGVNVPVRVRRRPDAVVAFDVPVVPGMSLAEIVAAGNLGVGACITVGVGVARSLAAMHAERVAHGDISAANVMVRGRTVTLVDTMGALCAERGTAGFAAPERGRGASPAGDVYSLGMLLRSVADARALPVIEAWTAPLLATDPGSRPTASHAARALERCAGAESIKGAESIGRASAPVVAAMRSSSVPRTVRRPGDRWWHAERMALRIAPLAVLAVVAAGAGWGLMPAMADAERTARSVPPVVDAPVTMPVSAAALIGPVDAAVVITALRVATLADGDSAGLRALALEGSPAARADAKIVAGLASGDIVFGHLEVLRIDAELQETTIGGAIVKVTTDLSGYSVGPKEVPPGTATALVELRLTQRGWLVERILPPA